jgi:hypothetical protein
VDLQRHLFCRGSAPARDLALYPRVCRVSPCELYDRITVVEKTLLCRELLLDAYRPPQSPREWEQWLTVTRKAMIHNAIVLRAGRNTGHACIPPPARSLLPAIRPH